MSFNKLLFWRLILYFLFFFISFSAQNRIAFPKNTKVILFRDFIRRVYIELNDLKSTSFSMISIPFANILQGKCFSSYCGYYSISSYIFSIYSASAYSFNMFYLYILTTFNLFSQIFTFSQAKQHRDVLYPDSNLVIYLYVVWVGPKVFVFIWEECWIGRI